ncbi:tetratricopeptide repeat protein [Pseudodesulfovibrio piezophilus]|uniref:Tetratricopeptide TPR_2 repeat protein n=1 Tax=Pseudodesulfovibrio piezophilus (strain DSM 21447 / JCM 15486 / C1TLV30) TaxID=1322246 RepID=M1WKW9_PSEP2|nr:tetratricopeptide repeat protein [Pseudodesulfovibrio piezophilus]CCH50326.1 Tetratricopeptide TPR_2 repeat protein [Pseudodesulfovibrio piezophilus C1TLV30]
MAKKIDKSRRNFLFGAVRRIKNEKSDGPTASTAEAVDTIKQANALYVDGQWEHARLKYKECIECDKNDADVRYRCGVCLYKVGKYRQAKLEFERTLRIQREYKDALLYLGLTLVRLERPEKATALWRQYFNPQAVPVQRELNLQLGMMEQGILDPPETIALAVEKAIDEAGDGVG